MAKKQGATPLSTAGWGGEAETVDELPRIGFRTNNRDGVPLGDRNEPWYWVVSPTAWQVLCGRVVPSMRKIVLHRGGGQNNVDSVKMGDGKMHADPTNALILAARKGETVLDFHDPRTFVEMPDGSRVPYLTRVRSTGGYISRFETVYGGTSDSATDTDWFTRWLVDLIDDGVIPQPPIHQLRRLQNMLAGQLAAYRDRAGTKAMYGARIKILEVDQKAVEVALRAHQKRILGSALPAETDDDLPQRPPVSHKVPVDANTGKPTDLG